MLRMRTVLAAYLLASVWLVLASTSMADDAVAKPAGTPAEDTKPAEQAKPAVVAEPAGAGADWSYWRGPQMNGNSTESGLPDSWNPDGGEGSNLLWKREDLATRSTPITLNGRMYLICRDKPHTENEGEKIVCLDPVTGQTIWEQRWNVYLSEVPDTRLAWSAVVGDPETGNVYALGVCGLFQAFKGDTGEILWAHSMHEEFGLLSTYGGRTNFPIIHEDNVIISAVIIGWGEQAKPTHRYIAFDKYNGQPVWFEGTKPFPEDTTYSAPVLGVFDGQAALVFGAGDGGVYALQPRTGKKLWSYQLSERGVNCSPVIYKDYVICGHSEENIGTTEMGGLVCLNGKDGSEVWKKTEHFVGKSPPIIAGDLLIAIEDGGKLYIMDPLTGKEYYSRKVDTTMRGSPLYADGKLYVLSGNGRWWIFKIVSEGKEGERTVTLEEIHKLRLNGEAGDGSPIASHGRICFATNGALYCIGNKDAKPAGGAVPPLPPESPRSDDQTPAQVQVVPVEGLLYPGQKQELGIRLYNARGQWIRNAEPSEVSFAVDGLGTIDTAGVFSTDATLTEHGAGLISAKVGEASGTARQRIIPEFPWSFKFDKGVIPVDWVGIRYRHVPLDFDLYEKLAKEDPQAAQFYVYCHSEFTNFGPKRTYDNSTAAMTWKGLMNYLNPTDEASWPKTVDEAKAKFDVSLQKLLDEKVLASFDWSTWELADGGGAGGPRLEVAKGERKIDGNGVLCKIQTIPKGTRSQGWIGHPGSSNYTIQADVFTPGKNGKMPDIGLVNQRYTLDMQGAGQKLQIRSWAAQLYHSQTIDFQWEVNTWYTLKFQSSVDGQTAVLKGKVWKKDEEEPADWTVTVTDPIGNLQGSPGFFGNAKDAEIFYDNVTVTSNLAADAKGAE
ncbi:MAG: PQQ-binding-like beta-propeller repeat protein [Planctomycetaceae bacterium]